MEGLWGSFIALYGEVADTIGFFEEIAVKRIEAISGENENIQRRWQYVCQTMKINPF